MGRRGEKEAAKKDVLHAYSSRAQSPAAMGTGGFGQMHSRPAGPHLLAREDERAIASEGDENEISREFMYWRAISMHDV